jgi:hypothetical protein
MPAEKASFRGQAKPSLLQLLRRSSRGNGSSARNLRRRTSLRVWTLSRCAKNWLSELAGLVSGSFTLRAYFRVQITPEALQLFRRRLYALGFGRHAAELEITQAMEAENGLA